MYSVQLIMYIGYYMYMYGYWMAIYNSSVTICDDIYVFHFKYGKKKCMKKYVVLKADDW